MPVEYCELHFDNVKLFIVETGTPVLCNYLFDRLDFSVIDRTAKRIRAIDTKRDLIKRNPEQPVASSTSIALPATLNKFATQFVIDSNKVIFGYKHNLILNKLVHSVVNSLRRVVLALLPKVKKKINCLMKTKFSANFRCDRMDQKPRIPGP